jgi:hypothetical protein
MPRVFVTSTGSPLDSYRRHSRPHERLPKPDLHIRLTKLSCSRRVGRHSVCDLDVGSNSGNAPYPQPHGRFAAEKKFVNIIAIEVYEFSHSASVSDHGLFQFLSPLWVLSLLLRLRSGSDSEPIRTSCYNPAPVLFLSCSSRLSSS